jgi:RimJ/RimL family protein N-acetyltransferase
MLADELPLSTGFPEPVTLRGLTTADAGAFARHVAADADHLGEYLPWPAITDNPEGAAAFLSAYERGDDGRVLIAGAWHGDELLGGALLFHHEEGSANIELGCWVVSSAQGTGVASAACLAVVELARSELGVERIEWRTTTVNERSRRLAEKLGFKHEGMLRSNYPLRTERYGSDVLSLVGEEIDQAVARG